MEEENGQVIAFLNEFTELYRSLTEICQSGNILLFTQINKTVKEMYRIQHGSEDPALCAIDEDCKVIYGNFVMIIAVLRTTENGEIDAGAQTALNRLLRNINRAAIGIAQAFGLISEG